MLAQCAKGRFARPSIPVPEFPSLPAEQVAPLLTDPVHIAAFLAGIVGLVYAAVEWKPLQRLFHYVPPLAWMYFLPMLATTAGITPPKSPVYSPFMSGIILPAVLVLLLIPTDIPALAKLGWKALGMMFFGTLGIVTGAIGSYALYQSYLPEGSWKALSALAGSWIGGSANMTAVIESVGRDNIVLGPVIIVDTVLAYSWLGLLIVLAGFQTQIDRFHRAETQVLDEVAAHLATEQAAAARQPRVADVAWMLGIAMVISQLCMAGGGVIHGWILQSSYAESIGKVVSGFGWGVLLVTAAGLIASLTPARKLEAAGASSFGYAGLYLVLTSFGAQANLRELALAPFFLVVAATLLLIHASILYLGMRILRAPVALAATASMANIGGPASAPVVAASYRSSLAPMGLLMAILGGIAGTPVALFVVAVACRAIAP
jgi:uncharacterized membrane protein